MNTPTRIKALESQKVLYTSVGNNVSFFLTKSGKVFVCGTNKRGELGLPRVKRVKEPRQVEFPGGETFIIIVCKQHSVVAISQKKKSVWVWGENFYHKLGVKSEEARSKARAKKKQFQDTPQASIYDPVHDDLQEFQGGPHKTASSSRPSCSSSTRRTCPCSSTWPSWASSTAS